MAEETHCQGVFFMDTLWAANTGIWLSFAVGTMLLTPVILEFGKRNLPVLFGVVIFILVIRSFSDQFPEMHSLWLQLGQIPTLLYNLVSPVFEQWFS
jgi:hypothetical protein